MHSDTIKTDIKDKTLFLRLLRYAKPYSGLLTFAILLTFAMTALDLLRPYLLKIAIDDHITGYRKPLIESSHVPADLDIPRYHFNGKEYVFLQGKSLEPSSQESPKLSILYRNGGYYLGDYVSPETEEYLTEEDYKQRYRLSESEVASLKKSGLKGITRVSAIFLASILLMLLIHFLHNYILNYTSQKIIFNIRNDVFRHLVSRSVKYFDNNPVGRLVTRVTNDTEALNEMYTSVLVSFLSDVFIVFGILIIMFQMNVQLALISLLLTPLIFFSARWFRSKIRVIYRKGREQLAKINANLNESITGMRIIQLFNAQQKFSEDFEQDCQTLLKISKKEIRFYAFFRPSIEIIRSLGIASLVYFGGGFVFRGKIEFGVLFLFIEYIGKFFNPILDLTEKFNILQSAMTASERIFTVLDDTNETKNPEHPIICKHLSGKIEFRNVWFAYNEPNWVLQDVSFTIHPGETIAFVGATGAGKSSIINLIMRFYDVQRGEVLIDDVNIKNYDKTSLRKKIGIVLQDVFLFTGDIEYNIKMNDENISHQQVVDCAKYTNANVFIEKLPMGYQEPVMERGATLSNGQRQLLSFARTLATDPTLIILDEATSNIDTETELLIQDALSRLLKSRTSIAVAHRLSTIQHSDRIILLHKGKIMEMGTHQDLIEQRGMYFDLYRLQYKENDIK